MDFFELPVDYEGIEYLFPAELLALGFTHRIKVTVEGTGFIFEPDEEGNYRSMVTEQDQFTQKNVDKTLLQEICNTLDVLFGHGNSTQHTIK